MEVIDLTANIIVFFSTSRWQTMLGQAVIDVKLEGRFAAGFYVVALTKKTV